MIVSIVPEGGPIDSQQVLIAAPMLERSPTGEFASDFQSSNENGSILEDGCEDSDGVGETLHGKFLVRVWDDEKFDFNQIKDVQLVLKYRYWTRFN